MLPRHALLFSPGEKKQEHGDFFNFKSVNKMPRGHRRAFVDSFLLLKLISERSVWSYVCGVLHGSRTPGSLKKLHGFYWLRWAGEVEMTWQHPR